MPCTSHEAFLGFVKLGWFMPDRHDELCAQDCPHKEESP